MTIPKLSAPLLPSAFNAVLAPVTEIIGTHRDHAADELRADTRTELPERAGGPTAFSRAGADAEVARSYAKTLAAGINKTFGHAPLVDVRRESTVGRWRTQLDHAFKEPGFLAWAREQNLNTGYLKVNPSRGEISGYVGGAIKTFSLSDDSGWSDISRTLLSISKVFAPETGQTFVYPLYGRDDQVPLVVVEQFYGEPKSSSTTEVHARIRQLLEKPGFDLPDNYVTPRSDEALSAHRQALGDNANRHALITALRTQVDDASGHIALDAVKIPIDPRSSLFASEQRSEMSAAQILTLEGNKVPVNSEQALETALGLSVDLAHRAPGIESGGTKQLSIKLGRTALRKRQGLVDEWKRQQLAQVPGTQTGPGANSVLSLLIKALPHATSQMIADHPTLIMDQLIRSPKALALGEDIQNTLKSIKTSTSAIENVNAALVHELDASADKSRFNVAGYDLYHKDNVGASPAEIVKRFVAHLEPRVGVELAALSARLLLSAVAPEFLVKNIPPGIIYGSAAWMNFCIQVMRIELQVPGASANMTYSQVMAFGKVPPVSFEGESELSAAMHDAIVAWGFANRITVNNSKFTVTTTELERIRQASIKQVREISWASEVLKTLPKTREALALEELRRVFPDIDPTLKVLQDTEVKHAPLSLLDIYMSGPVKVGKWKSLDENKFPYSKVKSRIEELEPDINQVFSAAFQDYRKTHESAWGIQFKYQLSLLPIADREKISQSDVSFFEVSRPFLDRVPSPLEVLTSMRFWPREPTEQELKALKGTQGLLMKVVDGGGNVSTYNVLPFEGRIVKENTVPASRTGFDDSSYFSDQGKGYVPGSLHVYNAYGTLNEDRDPPDVTGDMPGSYFSKKTNALAQAVGSFSVQPYENLKLKAAGVTEIEKGRAIDENLKEFFLSLVPFYDGVQDAIKGDIKGAVFNIGFDILGFALPAANAGRKASKAGKGLLTILTRGVFAGVGASVGYTDTVDIAKNLNKGAHAGYRDIKHIAGKSDEVLSKLRGNYKSYDVSKAYKEGDIVKGFFKSAEDNVWRPTVAILKAGGWYAYNVITKTPFGVQAAQFGVVSALEK